MHLQRPKRVELGCEASGPVRHPRRTDTFSPPPPPPCYCFKHSFAHSPVAKLASGPHNSDVQFSYARRHATSVWVQITQTHLKSVHKRGKKINEKQARCIHHKVYTLIPVHTARRTDTAATSPTAPWILLRGAVSIVFRMTPGDLLHSSCLRIAVHNLIPHTN